MDNIALYDNVFEDIQTTEDLTSFYKEMDQTIRLMFHVNSEITKVLDTTTNTNRKNAILKIIADKKLEPTDAPRIQEVLEDLKKRVSQFPIITLKLGYDPTREHLISFEGAFKAKVIFEILVERSLLGGAYITYKGIFKDYSLKTKLEEVFKGKVIVSR